MNGTYLALVTVAAATLVGARSKRRLGSRTLYMDYFESNPSIRPPSNRTGEITFDFPWPAMWGSIRLEVENVPNHWDEDEFKRWATKEIYEYWDEFRDQLGRPVKYANQEMRDEMSEDAGYALSLEAERVDPGTLVESDWHLDAKDDVEEEK
ncbi:hypothetical protein CMI47_00715 [Candidatus Pacearchaeota archaeon]|nr:hypothetical protein [Candidatus Pacearchaeota archaeon]|tara:strand:- start:1444 stop:1899 length:456 start_codon:yes stop_codon:yes gene_type:complete